MQHCSCRKVEKCSLFRGVRYGFFQADSALLGLCICMWWELSPPTPLLLSRSLSHLPPSLTSISAVPLFLSHPLAAWQETHTCFSAVLAGSALQPPSASHVLSLPHFSQCLPPVLLLVPALEQLMCLLPRCFTAIALPQFPWFYCSSCFILPGNHGRL